MYAAQREFHLQAFHGRLSLSLSLWFSLYFELALFFRERKRVSEGGRERDREIEG